MARYSRQHADAVTVTPPRTHGLSKGAEAKSDGFHHQQQEALAARGKDRSARNHGRPISAGFGPVKRDNCHSTIDQPYQTLASPNLGQKSHHPSPLHVLIPVSL